jgi:hypothetical protein
LTTRPTTTHLDRAAIVLSALCLVHCLAIPIALLLGATAGQWLVDTEAQVHWVLLALAVPLSAVALWRGYRKHGTPSILYIGWSGLALMFLGVSHLFAQGLFADQFEIGITSVGVTLVLIAHVRNLLLGHRHD